ncbi:MAG: FAD-binding oxidoreductase [Rhizobiaceae bacterium]|nr:FAD-binding oxidoreductase [Rhizobiaceae bacterium]
MSVSLPDFDTNMREALGERGWITSRDDIARQSRDWLDRFGAQPLGVARPESTAQVAEAVRICVAHGVVISPQGGNTGLAGGAVLASGDRGIIMWLGRMNRIVSIDPIDFTARVEAGVVLQTLHDALAEQDLIFPLHLGSEGSAQIGGLVGTNAGGSHAMRFGMMQDLVLGLEVVLPDGTVWDGARALIKDNAGYQLRRLFCGAEGTLGIVTGAVLRLFPAPIARATALLAVSDLNAAQSVGALLRSRTGEFLTAMEFFGEIGLGLAMKHVDGLSFPLAAPAPTYILVELTTSVPGIDLDDMLQNALAEGFESGFVLDGAIAANEAQRAAFWRLREEMPEGQRLEGPQIKHDVAVPVAKLAAFVTSASAAADAVMPGVRINPFGHLGDGNVHFNLTPPEGCGDFMGKQADLSRAIYDAAVANDGTISAEHGLGQAKVTLADQYRSDIERALMRRIKAALDPQAIMNPGKII